MNDPRRIFTAKQARQKTVACGGKCEMCGGDLEDGFHMHHIIPHSEGGSTLLCNCLALCPECHRRHHSEAERMAKERTRGICREKE